MSGLVFERCPWDEGEGPSSDDGFLCRGGLVETKVCLGSNGNMDSASATRELGLLGQRKAWASLGRSPSQWPSFYTAKRLKLVLRSLSSRECHDNGGLRVIHVLHKHLAAPEFCLFSVNITTTLPIYHLSYYQYFRLSLFLVHWYFPLSHHFGCLLTGMSIMRLSPTTWSTPVCQLCLACNIPSFRAPWPVSDHDFKRLKCHLRVHRFGRDGNRNAKCHLEFRFFVSLSLSIAMRWWLVL